tara:strand:+ start:129228 stop:130232 length:1005 start_codon:yes stop_codon:yes gene_type:complete
MIFPFLIPYLNGFRSFAKAPITWMIILVNLLIYLSSYEINNRLEAEWRMQMSNTTLMKMQGQIYADFVSNNKNFYDEFTLELAEQVKSGSRQSAYLMAGIALKDPDFVSTGSHFMSYKDPVAFDYWQGKFQTIINSQYEHPSQLLGVSHGNSGPATWLTYQFVHGDFMHFLVNMLFIMFFGAFLERLCGSLTFLAVYLGSGFVGAGVFILWSGVSTIPLVGASAAFSGIMAFLCVYLWTRPIKYIYWLVVPVRGYCGFVHLPAWIAFVGWLVTDMAGVLSESEAIVGAVAYTAHIGGTFAGALMALGVLAYKKFFLGQTFKANHRGFISRQIKV